MHSVEDSEPGRHDGLRGPVNGFACCAPRWFWPVAVAGTYAVGVLVVTLAEYVSEMAKIGRGTFTDSVSPYLFTNLLTWPTSAVHPHPIHYPATFSASIFRHLVREATIPTLANVAVQMLVIAAIVMLCSSLWRRRAAPA